ncbi:hypothetical protein [Streptomyces sp. NPDC058202]|uniref:hypothetical protein n=1 Tax=Streptomyces sp. NPDC058202 TaxID=3346380 RepID=UPI0036E762E3
MTDQTPWCCTGRVSECPLCPQYGTSLLDPCPGHPVNDNTQTAIDTARLHAEQRHPDYEYATTTGPRKQWDDADVPPYGDNGEPDTTWQHNLDAGYPGAGWERFDYTEEAYWRRPKTAAVAPAATEATDIETTARVFAGMHSSAEQTVNRVIDLSERWVQEGPPPLGVPLARWWDKRLAELHAAIKPSAPDGGPTVAEAAQADRNWDLQKGGE